MHLTDLIKSKYGITASESFITETKEQLLPKLQKWILFQALSDITQQSPEQAKKVNKLIDSSPTDETTWAFINTNIPDTTAFLTQTFLSFHQAYMEA